MVERIEKVSRVKGIEYDAYRPFERKDGYQEKGKAQQHFSQVLRKAMDKDENHAGSDSYRLELHSGRATQSLFYLNGVDLRHAQAKMSRG